MDDLKAKTPKPGEKWQIKFTGGDFGTGSMEMTFPAEMYVDKGNGKIEINPKLSNVPGDLKIEFKEGPRRTREEIAEAYYDEKATEMALELTVGQISDRIEKMDETVREEWEMTDKKDAEAVEQFADRHDISESNVTKFLKDWMLLGWKAEKEKQTKEQ